MQLEIRERSARILPEYEKIPMAFEVKSIFRVELSDDGLSGVKFVEEAVEKPFVKDYDALDAERPSRWHERFDIENWGFLTAHDGEKPVGGAAIAWRTPEIFMLEGSDELACLWDLRVAPEYRGRGVGRMLFDQAVKWAQKRGCRLFKVETQNVNVPACRFYVRQGCHLGAFGLHAYPAWMNEVQLVWYRKI